MNKSIPEMSVETRLLLQRLEKAAVGETVSYAELTNLCGRDVQGPARGMLYSAMRATLSSGVVFATVRKTGVKRLADNEIVGVGEAAIPRIRRLARRSVRKLTAVQDFDAMPNEAKIRHNTMVSMLGAVAHVTGSKTVKEVQLRVAAAQNALPLRKTLAAFGGEQPGDAA